MKPLAREWIQKAQADLFTARREAGVKENPNFDAVCFHAQQAVERAPKAMFVQFSSTPPKTRELVFLIDLLQKTHLSLAAFRDACARLTEYAVEFRCPGEIATESDARQASQLAESALNEILKLLRP